MVTMLKGKDKENAMQYLCLAEKIAHPSSCLRKKCGAVIVKDGEILGSGFNSPPAIHIHELFYPEYKAIIQKYGVQTKKININGPSTEKDYISEKEIRRFYKEQKEQR